MSKTASIPKPGNRVAALLARHAFLIKAVAVIIAIVAFIILVRSVPVERPLEWLRERVHDLGFWAPLVFILTFIALTTVLLPGWPLNVAAGALFGPFWGGVLTSIASTSAAGVSFLIGRFLAHGAVLRNIHNYPRLHAVYKVLGKKEQGWKVVAAVRLSHSLPYGLQNFLLGVSPVKFGPYLLATWLVSLPGIFFVAYLGHLGGMALAAQDAQEPTSPWIWAARGVGVLFAGVAVFYLGRVAYRAIKEQTHIELNGNVAEESARRGEWPWGSLAALLAALLFLAAAVWAYAERERLRESIERMLAYGAGREAIVKDEHST